MAKTVITYSFSHSINHSSFHSSALVCSCRCFPNWVTFPDFLLLQTSRSPQILKRCQSAFKRQTLEVQKHVVWKHARSSVSYIQPSCRGPWKRRARVGVRRGHFAPQNCPLTLHWRFRLTVESTVSILMVSLLLKGGRWKHLGICSSLCSASVGEGEGRGYIRVLCHTAFPGISVLSFLFNTFNIVFEVWSLWAFHIY